MHFKYTPDQIASFWSRFPSRLPDDCWLWLSTVNYSGYGIIMINWQRLRAHRVAWEIARGPIPPGLFVLHQCDQRRCCNPAHLRLGTQQENLAEMRARGRSNEGGWLTGRRERTAPAAPRQKRPRERQRTWPAQDSLVTPERQVWFWTRVNRRSPLECWPWRGPTTGDYGHLYDASAGRMVRAHRLAWIMTHGALPPHTVILHLCDTPICCNPDHLRAGTQAENLADMRAKGRAREGVNNKGLPGTRNPMVKLTEPIVLAIRAACADGGQSQQQIAKRFGVSQMTISLIAQRKTWTHL